MNVVRSRTPMTDKPTISLKQARWKRALRRSITAFVGGALFAPVTFFAAVRWLPYPQGIDRPPPADTFIQDRNGFPLAAFVASDEQWQLPLTHDQFSPHLVNAIIAVEDARFVSHAGVDWHSVTGAVFEDLRHLSIRRGGSTLTMQLERLRDPRPRTFLNKVEQAIRAAQLEKRATKQDILDEYLNRAPFGGNLVGAGAASWRYFGRPCRDLSLAEAALLAGLPQSPNRLRPDRHPQAAKLRRDHVLARMQICGTITEAQRKEASGEPLDARWRDLPQATDIGALAALEGLRTRYPSQSIRTTVDRPVQQSAAAMAATHLEGLKASHITAVAVVILDTPTSECLASVSLSARDPRGPSKAFLDLTRAPRSPGSTLKPFLYAAAFDAGIASPASILMDSPAAWPGYVPANYDRAFHGPISAGDALAESRNIPALLLLNQLGVERAVALLDSFGLHTLARAKYPYGLPLAIGAADATAFELAEADATLARGGLWRAATLVHSENAIERRTLRADACWQTLCAISAPERTAPISPEAAGLKVAWKTGTSTGHHDAWCAAATPRRTVIVWLGNPAGESSAALIGQEAAAPLALRLIAAVDPGGKSWPEAPVAKSLARAIAAPGKASLQIISPTRDQRILLSPDLPAANQQVLFESSAENPWWFLDGESIGRGRRLWWSPTAGAHRLRLTDDDGHSASVAFHVDWPSALSRADPSAHP